MIQPIPGGVNICGFGKNRSLNSIDLSFGPA